MSLELMTFGFRESCTKAGRITFKSVRPNSDSSPGLVLSLQFGSEGGLLSALTVF
jgi:hypothetical protein